MSSGWHHHQKSTRVHLSHLKPKIQCKVSPTAPYVAFLGVGVGDPGIERRPTAESALLAVAVECKLPLSSAAGPRPKIEPTCCLPVDTLLERRERVDHARKDWAGARVGVRRVFPLTLW